jgi:hypothetical protein
MSYLLNVANERPMLRISEAADAATNDTARGQVRWSQPISGWLMGWLSPSRHVVQHLRILRVPRNKTRRRSF